LNKSRKQMSLLHRKRLRRLGESCEEKGQGSAKNKSVHRPGKCQVGKRQKRAGPGKVKQAQSAQQKKKARDTLRSSVPAFKTKTKERRGGALGETVNGRKKKRRPTVDHGHGKIGGDLRGKTRSTMG